MVRYADLLPNLKPNKRVVKDLLATAKKVKPITAKISVGEETLVFWLKQHKIEFEREYKLSPNRKWRCDFALIKYCLIIEVEGNGRHTTYSGFRGDIEKYNYAAKAGWFLLRFTTEMTKNGIAIADIQEFIKNHEASNAVR